MGPPAQESKGNRERIGSTATIGGDARRGPTTGGASTVGYGEYGIRGLVARAVDPTTVPVCNAGTAADRKRCGCCAFSPCDVHAMNLLDGGFSGTVGKRRLG